MSDAALHPFRASRALIVIAAIVALALQGCASLQPGADPVVVNAERTTSVAADTFDSFLKIEYDNRAALQSISPQIHVFAESIRRNGQNWLQSARALTNAYKLNRTTENKASLETAIAVLSAAMNEANKYIALANNSPSQARH